MRYRLTATNFKKNGSAVLFLGLTGLFAVYGEDIFMPWRYNNGMKITGGLLSLIHI